MLVVTMDPRGPGRSGLSAESEKRIVQVQANGTTGASEPHLSAVFKQYIVLLGMNPISREESGTGASDATILHLLTRMLDAVYSLLELLFKLLHSFNIIAHVMVSSNIIPFPPQSSSASLLSSWVNLLVVIPVGSERGHHSTSIL